MTGLEMMMQRSANRTVFTGWLRRCLLALVLAVGLSDMSAAQPVKGYLIGPDDAIQVIIYGQPEASITTRVKADGTIVMPFIGTIKVDGMDNVALAKFVGDQMEKGGYLKAPVVNVEISQYVSRSVNVAGRVATPGIVPLDRQYRALEVLLKAGWIAPSGASYVFLRRGGQPERRLSTEELVRGAPEQDPVLQAGDTLYVPDADQFYIYGQINRPGSFPVLPGMTGRQAVAIAGGVTATGSSNKVGLLRGNEKERDTDLSFEIQKNDVIVVKERLF